MLKLGKKWILNYNVFVKFKKWFWILCKSHNVTIFEVGGQRRTFYETDPILVETILDMKKNWIEIMRQKRPF